MKKSINLIYFADKSRNGNFGDELSKVILDYLINKKDYNVVYNQSNIPRNIICIGSYIHMAKDSYYIYGSGVRTHNNIEQGHKYTTLHVCAVRGPLTRDFLLHKNIRVPEIYGDPALLLPKFYIPRFIPELKDKIGIIPHKSNYMKYVGKLDTSVYVLISPTDVWQRVIDSIYSCKSILSSSLHGLICSDAYTIPNLWLDEYPLIEGDFKFKDYFASQKREYVKITCISQYQESLLYKGGNTIDLDVLLTAFPF